MRGSDGPHGRVVDLRPAPVRHLALRRAHPPLRTRGRLLLGRQHLHRIQGRLMYVQYSRIYHSPDFRKFTFENYYIRGKYAPVFDGTCRQFVSLILIASINCYR